MHVAFDRRAGQRIRLALQRDSDVTRKHGLTKEAANVGLVVAPAKRKRIAVCRNGRAGRNARGDSQCARSSEPFHESSPSGNLSRRMVSIRSMLLIGKKLRNMNASDRFTSSNPRRMMLDQP